MKYIFEKFVTDKHKKQAEAHSGMINVRFCDNCPYFELEAAGQGWCKRMSMENHYVHVKTTSFCNENDI